MKLEVGKYYRTAEGEKVGPMLAWAGGENEYHFDGDEDGRLWWGDGTRRYGDSDGVIVAEWVDPAVKFKVGDRVRVAGGETPEFGVLVFEDIDGTWLVHFDGWDGGHNAPSSGLTLSGSSHYWVETRRLAQAAPAALTIQAGKFYKTRDGRKVGPMVATYDNEYWPFNSAGYYFKRDGFSCPGQAHNHKDADDLIAEPPALATALPTVGDWVKDQGGRIGIVFHDDGDDYANLKVGMTEDGDVEYYSPRDLTIVPPGTKPANDNYEVGDIVEIVDTGIFDFSVSVGDIAAVTDTDGDISIRVQTKDGPVDQVVFLENASHIRPYRRTA